MTNQLSYTQLSKMQITRSTKYLNRNKQKQRLVLQMQTIMLENFLMLVVSNQIIWLQVCYLYQAAFYQLRAIKLKRYSQNKAIILIRNTIQRPTACTVGPFLYINCPSLSVNIRSHTSSILSSCVIIIAAFGSPSLHVSSFQQLHVRVLSLSLPLAHPLILNLGYS